MLSLGMLLHLFSLFVAVVGDAIGRVAGSAPWPAGSLSSFHLFTRGRLHAAASTEQRDRELPVALYGKPYRGAEQGAAPAERCAFCLSGIEEGDEVRVILCRHLFHRGCLDRWLVVARPWATCPLCRGELLVPPTCAGEEEEEEVDGVGVTGMAAFMAYVYVRYVGLAAA